MDGRGHTVYTTKWCTTVLGRYIHLFCRSCQFFSDSMLNPLKICLFSISETQQGIFDAVLKGFIDFESDPWPLISDSAKDLIRKMLCSKPAERLTAHEVLCMLTYSICMLTNY